MPGRVKTSLSDFIQQADVVLLSLCCVATLFGMVLITSATHYLGTYRYVIVQGVAMCIGICAYIILSLVDLELLVKHWKWIFVFNVVFILLLIPFGKSVGGNRAWIQMSWMPTSVQPAEIVKITFILLFAKQLEWTKEKYGPLKPLKVVFPLAAHLLFMVGLIYVVSSDTGSALVYVFVFLCMALVAGLAWRWFILGLGGGTAGIIALYKLGYAPQYMVKRFHAIIDHSFDPLGAGWQQTRSLLAIGSGKITGMGLFQGTQTQSPNSYSLPARHTDYIFAVAGEELGLLGAILILGILTAVIVRCLQAARHAKSSMSAYICVGMAGMLIFQLIANVGMCIFVMPVIGLTLPFFSYGGSSIVTLFSAMGIVSCIRKQSGSGSMFQR